MKRPAKKRTRRVRQIDSARLTPVTGGNHGTLVFGPNGSVFVIRDEGA